jgi:hypothetical protein
MSELTCSQCRDLGAELALGILGGRQRAQVLAHLDGCIACRDQVRELTVLGDEVAGLVPGAEPPMGFEERTLARLPVPITSRPRRWRVPATAAAAVILLVAGWALGTFTHPTRAPAAPTATGASVQSTVMAAALTSGGLRVGEVYAQPGSQPWIAMAVDLDRPTNAMVSCQLQRRDGSTVTVGAFPLAGGYGYWAGPAPLDRDTLTSAQILDTHGQVLASATFTH